LVTICYIDAIFDGPLFAERIADQKFAVKSLVRLYRYSVDTPGRHYDLPSDVVEKDDSLNPSRILKKALKRMRSAATTTTTALGNVASEIAGR
jgi:hypothetical protein